MPKRQYETGPRQLLAKRQMIINTTDDAKFRHKVELVNLVLGGLGGLSPSFLSEFYAESKNTITLWVKIADEKGFDALRTRKPTGWPAKLSQNHHEPAPSESVKE